MTLSIREQLYGFVAALVLGIILGVFVRPSPSGSDLNVTLSHPAPNVATLQVPVPVVTEKVVKEYVRVEDRTAVAALLEENRKLKVQVQQLSTSIAEYQSAGTGTAVITLPTTTLDTSTPPPPVHTEFKDWRLSFTLNGTNANYTLTQKFAIINTVGKNKKNVPTQLIRLYEVGPNETRTLIPTVETTTVAATENLPHTYVHMTIQAGAGALFAASSAPTTAQRTTAGIGVVSWLKRGRSIATEETRWSYAAPAIAFTNTDVSVGVSPIAFNIGSLPKQPLTNIWMTPFIGTTTTDYRKITRIGIFATATF